MREIYLDLSQPCPEVLANVNHPNTIGCAVGEILFQAGVPLDQLDGKLSIWNLLMERPAWMMTLRAWLGVTAAIGHADFIKTLRMIEPVYDSIAHNGLTAKRKRRINTLGHRVNVHFVFGNGEQRQTICRAEPKRELVTA